MIESWNAAKRDVAAEQDLARNQEANSDEVRGRGVREDRRDKGRLLEVARTVLVELLSSASMRTRPTVARSRS